jgi:hypothetical protein
MPTFNTTDPKPGYVYDSAIDTWFPLVGIAPASQVDRWTKTAAGGETSLSGNDDNAVSLSYTSGTEQVYLNGVLLVRGQDYTATNGTTITGLTALAASDVAEVVTFNPSNILTTDAVIATDFAAKGDLISASAASTPVRLPVGTTGQVLKANSATTSGLEWATAAADIEGVTAGTGLTGGGTSGTVTLALDSAAVIAPTIVNAKGDLISASADNTPAILSVGTNGQVLTAASGEATGLQWATPVPGDKSKIWPKDSTWYLKPYHTSTTNFTCVEDTTYYIPFYLPNYALDRIGIRTSSNSMNIGIRLGIYNTDLTTGRPSTVYLDAGTVTATAINTNYEITISTTPPAGYYWLAVNVQTVTSGSTELIAYTGSAVNYGNYGQATSTLQGTNLFMGYSQTGVTGAFATAGTLTPHINNPVLVTVRMA